MTPYTLREALSLATSDQRLLHDDITQYILNFCYLMRQASLHSAAERWIISTLPGAPRPKATRADSSLSDHSVDRLHPQYRDETSSGRRTPKRATRCSTSDSDSTPPSPRWTTRKGNAADRDDSDLPSCPPRIDRHRARRIWTQTPFDSAASADSLLSIGNLIGTITTATRKKNRDHDEHNLLRKVSHNLSFLR